MRGGLGEWLKEKMVGLLLSLLGALLIFNSLVTSLQNEVALGVVVDPNGTEEDTTAERCSGLKDFQPCIKAAGCQWNGERCHGEEVFMDRNPKDMTANPWLYYADDKLEQPLNAHAERKGELVKGECYCADVADKEKKGGKNCKTVYNGRPWCYVSPETGSGCSDTKTSRMEGYDWSYQACIDQSSLPNCQCDPTFKGKDGGPKCKTQLGGRLWCYIQKGKSHSACRDAKASSMYPDKLYSYQACYNSYDFKDAPLPHPREVEEIDSVLHRKKYIADLYNEKDSLVKEMRSIKSRTLAKIEQMKKKIQEQKKLVRTAKTAADRNDAKHMSSMYREEIKELHLHIEFERKRSDEEKTELDRQIKIAHEKQQKAVGTHQYNSYLGW